MENTEIIILAAGKGTRMGSELPKCLLPVRGIPMIERLLTNIGKSLYNKALMVVGHRSDDIKNALGDRVRYTHQLEQKGTAHATLTALDALLPDTSSLIVLYGDHPFVSNATIDKLISGLSKHKIVIGISDAGDYGDWKSVLKHYGRIIYNDSGTIDGVIEYKDANDEIRMISHVNCGYYAFDRAWLKSALLKVKPLNSQGEYYLTDVVRIARDDRMSIGHIMVDPFEALGLNSREDVAHAEKLM